eukprot:GFUD01121514.1.p2 GENE.GFUD01121514.1~~GFUD01121514.1.p2  ORF type:complete len:229 (-),score=67.47 GFUD01121514.1:48-734(-)
MASSSTSSDSRVMYTVVDKISGQKVGVLVCEGHEVPDLGQMKLKICPDGSVEQKWPVVGDPFIGKRLDINGNKAVSILSETFKKLVIPTLTEEEPICVEPLPFTTTAASSSSSVSDTPICSTAADEMITDPKSSTASLFSPSNVSVATSMVKLVMISNKFGGGDRKKWRGAKIMSKSGDKVERAMKTFGRKFGQDFRNLRFLSDDKQLTGKELAGGLDGSIIIVLGLN